MKKRTSPETDPEFHYPLPVVTDAAAAAMIQEGQDRGPDFFEEVHDRMLKHNPHLAETVGVYMAYLGIVPGSPEADQASLLLALTHELLIKSSEIE